MARPGDPQLGVGADESYIQTYKVRNTALRQLTINADLPPEESSPLEEENTIQNLYTFFNFKISSFSQNLNEKKKKKPVGTDTQSFQVLQLPGEGGGIGWGGVEGWGENADICNWIKIKKIKK